MLSTLPYIGALRVYNLRMAQAVFAENDYYYTPV
jgi:hypothetical protein